MYGGTKAELERLVKDAEQLTGKALDPAKFSDVITAIHAVQENMGITGTTAREAATTIQGSVNTMRAAWSNWLTGLGNEDADMSALTDNLIQSVITAGENIIPRVGVIMTTLVQTVASYAPQVGQALLNGLSNIGKQLVSVMPAPVQSAISTIVTTIQSGLQQIPGIFSTVQGVFSQFSGVADTVFSAIGGKVNEFITTVQNIASIISPVIQGIVDGIGNFAAAFVGAFSLSGGLGEIGTLVSTISSLSSPLGIVGNIINQFAPTLQQLATTIGSSLVPMFTTLGQILGGTLAAAIPAVQAGFSAFQSILSAVIPTIANLASVILPTVASVLQTLAPIIMQIVTFVSSLVTAIAPLVSTLVSSLMPVITNIVTAIMNFVTSVAPVITTVISTIMTVLNALLPVITNIISVIVSVVTTIITYASMILTTVMNVVSTIASAIGTVISVIMSIVSVIATVFGTIVATVTGAVATFVSIISSGFNFVANIVSTVVNTVAGFIASLFANIVNTFTSIVSTIQSAMTNAYNTGSIFKYSQHCSRSYRKCAVYRRKPARPDYGIFRRCRIMAR